MYVLNLATEIILGWLGMTGGTGHGTPHNEEEIRALLAGSPHSWSFDVDPNTLC